MITGKRDTVETDRGNTALVLLESSGYTEPWKSEIADRIIAGSPDEIELIIQDLLMNQVDNWANYRNKDIQRRLNRIC